jgi:hypothetical protein
MLDLGEALATDVAKKKSFPSAMTLQKDSFLITTYVYTGRHLVVIQRSKEEKSRTLQARRDYNGTARGQGSGL